MKTLKRVAFLILLLVAIMTIFTITVKAATAIKQTDTINEQEIKDSKNDVKEPEKALKLETKEEETSTKEKNTQEKMSHKEESSEEEAITEAMDPNNEVEVVQYPEEQDQQVTEEKNYSEN